MAVLTTPLSDAHAHSRHSADGYAPVRAMAEEAVRKGLSFLTVTDHYDSLSVYDLETQWREVEETREEFAGRLTVLHGVELGEAILVPERADALTAALPHDFILGSHHCLSDMEDFYYLKPKTAEECQPLIERYLDELAETAARGQFDVMGHFTYPLRYFAHREGLPVDFSPWRDRVEAILRTLADAGRGVELNISGLRRTPKYTLPDLELLRWFRGVGGEVVTVGTDAHRASDVGAHVGEGYEILRAAGFSHVAVFVGRKPRMMTL